MLSALWNLICFGVALGILVTVHEAGHFFAARACKVKVLRFSLGFGKVLFKKTGKDGCEYAVSMIPLGGYVKMLGETDENERSLEGSFKSKGRLQRFFIIAAGPLSNIILAIILYTGLNLSGVTVLRPVVGDVVPGSIAAEAGFQVYDRIESVGGDKTESWQDFLVNIVANIKEDNVAVEVRGDLGKGQSRSLNLNLEDYDVNPRSDPLTLLGLKRCLGRVNNIIETVQPGSAAEQAGIRPGDSIESINGSETPTWFRVQDEIARTPGGPVKLVVKREGQLYESEFLPQYVYDKSLNRNKAFLGIGVNIEKIDGLSEEIQYSFSGAFLKALSDTKEMSRLVAVAAYKMVSGAISAENISGPIAIAKGAGESAAVGIAFFISFLAAISVNLGILNLLPIPVLDGGQLLFIVYETLTGREPNQRVQVMLTSLGFAVLLSLMLFSVFNDLRGLG